IDVNGYLKISLEEAAEKTEASAIQMLDALTLLQQLDPAGSQSAAKRLEAIQIKLVKKGEAAPEGSGKAF
ncbi:RNA polymerase factor sigma-54, partial [Enterococcus faecalis]|uniref:RNA polymerase factor sigma-54 n=1 Tax=Enterococcus faecalis TaxID=1351 RepID=UPI003FA3AB5A